MFEIDFLARSFGEFLSCLKRAAKTQARFRQLENHLPYQAVLFLMSIEISYFLRVVSFATSDTGSVSVFSIERGPLPVNISTKTFTRAKYSLM